MNEKPAVKGKTPNPFVANTNICFNTSSWAKNQSVTLLQPDDLDLDRKVLKSQIYYIFTTFLINVC